MLIQDASTKIGTCLWYCKSSNDFDGICGFFIFLMRDKAITPKRYFRVTQSLTKRLKIILTVEIDRTGNCQKYFSKIQISCGKISWTPHLRTFPMTTDFLVSGESESKHCLPSNIQNIYKYRTQLKNSPPVVECCEILLFPVFLWSSLLPAGTTSVKIYCWAASWCIPEMMTKTVTVSKVHFRHFWKEQTSPILKTSSSHIFIWRQESTALQKSEIKIQNINRKNTKNWKEKHTHKKRLSQNWKYPNVQQHPKLPIILEWIS